MKPASHLPTQPAQARAALLLVEDDALLRSDLADRLTAAGYAVTAAADGDTARAGLHTAAPELILLDLGLPPDPHRPTVGLALIDEIARDGRAASIIVLTGQNEEAVALEALKRGATDFLTKPASWATLAATLERSLRLVRWHATLAEHGCRKLSFFAHEEEGPKEAADVAQERLVRSVFAACEGNVAATARRLGLPREQLYYYLRKFGIERSES